MNKKLKKTIFTVLPVAIGIGLIWFSVSKLTPEDKQAIQSSFESANYWWIFLSLVFGILSHLSRAYRWQFLLAPLGYKPKFANSVMAVLVAYLVNLLVPRAGEIARATTISKYEKIPFEKAFGTIVSERIADVLILLGITLLAFVLQTELISAYLFKEEAESSHLKWYILIGIGIIGFIFYRLIKNSSNPLIQKIQKFLHGLILGAISIFRMKNKWSFIFHTLFIWLMYVLMFYVVTFAIPETQHLPFGAIIVGFVVGGISMALTNGGLGTYPIFVASALTLYKVPLNPALAFGWIMWTAQTLMVLVFGGLSFLLLPIYNRNLKD
ncbi:MAG: lysylphosphatidylglycerol synthase transmembrane domain-containing protein [Lutimonas sp.]